MGESKHTPAPWVADVDYEHGPLVTGVGGDIVADFTMWDGHREEARANAHLISAAPDLLDVAKTVLAALDAFRCGGEFPDFHAWERDTRAAIAKATGGQG